MKALIFCLPLLSIFICLDAQSYEDVDDLVNKLSSLTEPTLDVFKNLKFIRENSGPLLNLVGTATGPLFTSLAKLSGLAPDSEEFKAIKKLHTAVLKGFASVANQQTKLTRDLKVHSMKISYYNWVEGIVSSNCARPTASRLRLLFEAHDLFSNTESKFSSDLTARTFHQVEAYNWAKSGISKVRGNISHATVLDIIQATTALPAVSESDMCFLTLTYTNNGLRRQPIENLVNIVSNDVKLLELASGLCTIVRYSNDLNKIAEENLVLGHTTKTIIDSMTSWLNLTLEGSWPAAYEKIAKELIGSDDIPIDVMKYDSLAWKIARELSDNCGPDRFSTQVLISENFAGYEDVDSTNYGKDFVDDCADSSACFVLKNYKNIHIALLRYGEDVVDSGRSNAASDWFHANKEDMKMSIQENYKWTDYLAANTGEKKKEYLEGMLKNMEKSIPGLRDMNLYKSRILLHGNVVTKSSVEIHSAYTNFAVGMGTDSGANVVTYSENNNIDNDLRFELYFFL
ncbi:hypothetical protein DdX_19357 [Ditylenchus destructor]|uniref:Uncharacterized protein n=1 Tax=Ditylenchus destructor TaxID=166010 RepID=A0AAD4MJ92_9BILA|nr:hypothetical protein DdX_19357 [Ditylenchus destructor]